MPIANISNNFSAQIDKLTADTGVCGNAPVQKVGRSWMRPTANGWDGNPLTLTGTAGIAAAFARDDLNAAYVKAVDTAAQADGGRLVDRWVSKAQVDYLAAMERAFRARHATSARCTLHAAARRAGQGSSGGVYSAVRDYLTTVLQAGYSAPKGPA